MACTHKDGRGGEVRDHLRLHKSTKVGSSRFGQYSKFTLFCRYSEKTLLDYILLVSSCTLFILTLLSKSVAERNLLLMLRRGWVVATQDRNNKSTESTLFM